MIGGSNAAEGAIPGMLGLIHNNENYGGAILIGRGGHGRAVALTAAHCLNYDLNKVTVRGGSLKWYSGGRTAAVKEYFIHPDYALPKGIDLAVLVLDGPLEDVPLAPAVAGQGDAALYVPGAEVTMAGWGPEVTNGRNWDDLQAFTLSLVEPESCDREGRASNADFACCRSGSKKTTAGDSGGPVIGGSGDARRLLGSIEGGKGGASIATRTDKQAAWIGNPRHIHSYVVGSDPAAIAVVPGSGRKYILHDGGTVSVLHADWSSAGKLEFSGAVRAIVGSPVGKVAYVTYELIVSAINFETGLAIGSVVISALSSALAITSDGRLLFVSHGNSVTIIDTATMETAGTVNLNFPPSALAVTPDGKRIYVITGEDTEVRVIDFPALSVSSWDNGGFANTCVAATADHVYVGSNGREVNVRDYKGKQVAEIQLLEYREVKSLALSQRELYVGYETIDSTPAQAGVQVFDTSHDHQPLRARQLGRAPLGSLTPLPAGGIYAVNRLVSSISVISA